jgi:hypothetical protein
MYEWAIRVVGTGNHAVSPEMEYYNKTVVIG